MSRLFLFWLLFFSLFANAQNSVKLEWNLPVSEWVYEGKTVTRLNFTRAFYPGLTDTLPALVINEYVSGAVKKAQIIVEETAYEDLTAKEEQLIGNFEVPSSVEFELTYKRVGNQTLIQAIGIPLVALSGKVKKVSSLKYRIEVLERGSTSAQRRGSNFKVSSTGSSPLKNGNWHRVGVTAEGVYKLDYN